MIGPFRRERGRLATLLLAVAPGACAPSASLVELAPVTPVATGEYHPGQFVWHDLVTDDPEAAKAFYGALFGWRFEDVDGDLSVYSVIERDGRPIGGIVPIQDEDPAVASARWLSLLSVEDVDDAISTLERSGGAVEIGPRDNPTRGRMALVRDPQGALVVLIRSVGGDPPNREESDVGAGDWLWTELWAEDAASATSFYASLVGYSGERPDVEGAHDGYRVLYRDGRPRAGVNEIPWENVRPNWLPYIRVDDPAAVARRAEELGGSVLIAPSQEVRGGSAALLMDPTGAAFAIQRWPVAGADGSQQSRGLGGVR
jgi:predicted enzyme related to lactoylglutathione lyase